jgi:demethylmenaquinone methyltransferase / 2-methoxy-6-polyprenyl-1,4-benzoquinol methylase
MAVVPYKNQEGSKKEQVAKMFDNISGNYDLLNRLLSVGIDIYWRKQALKKIKAEKPSLILDVATGTADFALEALSLRPQKIIGVDISEGMLALGRQKVKNKGVDHLIELRKGDSEKLDFPDNTFDAVIVSFGVRNFEDLEAGLSDIKRVLKENGTLVVLEFSKPTLFPFKQLYWFYFRAVLPFLGRIISKDTSAYTYLPESVEAFPYGKEFVHILQKTGYLNPVCTPLTFGICSVYTGKK